MPGLRPECIQLPNGEEQEEYCGICGENNCFVALSPRGDTILFADGEEAITSGPRCDCIMVLRRNNAIEIYSIELKEIRTASAGGAREALSPDEFRQKCENCLRWALSIVERFGSTRRAHSMRINRYCVLVLPSRVYQRIATLISRERRRYRASVSDEGRILFCNTPITGQSIIF